MKLTEVIDRAKVIATQAVTWLTFAAVTLTIVAEELAKVWSGEKAQDVTALILRVVAWLGAAIAIIRRSTPVNNNERGILP